MFINNQVGFLKNRYMKDNICKIMKLLDLAVTDGEDPHYFLFFRCWKSFDHVTWLFI